MDELLEGPHIDCPCYIKNVALSLLLCTVYELAVLWIRIRLYTLMPIQIQIRIRVLPQVLHVLEKKIDLIVKGSYVSIL
jgi:hypothetical protein